MRSAAAMSSGNVRLTSGLVRKRIEDPERGRSEPHGEPRHGRRFFEDEREPVTEQLFHFPCVSWIGFESDEEPCGYHAWHAAASTTPRSSSGSPAVCLLCRAAAITAVAANASTALLNNLVFIERSW